MTNKINSFLLALLLGPCAVIPVYAQLNPEFKDPLDTWAQPDDPRFDAKSLGKDLGINWEMLEKQFRGSRSIREEYHNLQQEYIKKYNDISNKPDTNYLRLSKEFSQSLLKWIAEKFGTIIDDKSLSKELAFISFGSLARLEAGPVTDLEVALVWNPAYKDKDARDFLSYDIANKTARFFEGLIGHPLFGRKGFRLDEAKASPFHLAPWAQNLTLDDAYCWFAKSLPNERDTEEQTAFKQEYFVPFEGSWAYASTPEALADMTTYDLSGPTAKNKILEGIDSIFFHKPFIKEKLKKCADFKNSNDDKIEEAATNIRNKLIVGERGVAKFFRYMQRNHSFVYGEKSLFDEFDSRLKNILNTQYDEEQNYRKAIAIDSLKSLYQDFKSAGQGMFISGKMPEWTDLKRYHYRLEEQVLTNLSFYYNLGVQNGEEILNALREKKLIGDKLAKQWFERLNEITRLRWKEQIAIGEQLKTGYNFLNTKSYDDEVLKINEKIASADKIIKNSESEPLDIIAARFDKSEQVALLKTLEGLRPESKNSILDKNEIELIENKIIPGEVDLLKRVKQFLDNDPQAFQDQ